MDDERATEKDLSILLRRPFMATAKTIIDVQNRKLYMTVLGESVEFQDESKELLELKRELEKGENEERPCLGSTKGKDDLEIGLEVVKKRQLEVESKPCRNKPCRPKPNLEERVREEELQLLNTSSVDLISDCKWLREHLAGHADDSVLDVH
ncbi:hypothetical protein ACOSQ2_028447 [Xanthoceras sorbifolium]